MEYGPHLAYSDLLPNSTAHSLGQIEALLPGVKDCITYRPVKSVKSQTHQTHRLLNIPPVYHWLIKQNLSQIHAIVAVLNNLKECFESTFCGLSAQVGIGVLRIHNISIHYRFILIRVAGG